MGVVAIRQACSDVLVLVRVFEKPRPTSLMADAAAELETISDDVVEDDVVPSPKRPRLESSKKYSGASIYKSKYKVSWEKKWPFVTAVQHDQHSFYCKHCSKIISCAHQGERDVVRHIASNQHKKNSKSVQNTAPLNFASSECINKVHCIKTYNLLSS